MKHLIKYLPIVCLFLVTGCGKDNGNSVESTGGGKLAVSATELIFISEGEEKTFTIESDSEWIISCVDTWCKVNPANGAGDAIITVKADPHEDYDDRSTSLFVSSGDSTRFITVIQKKKNAILLTKDKYNVSAAGEIITVEVKSNINYRVVIPEKHKEWIKEIPRARALETQNLNFEIAPNEITEKRNGIIVFEDMGTALTDTVYIFQEQEYLSFSDELFQQYLLDNFDMDNDGRLSISEAASVDIITLSGGVGLENMYYFPNLKSLSYEKFQQKELDLSKNILLEFLNCYDSQLTELDVSNCSLLTELRCYMNKQLTLLDVSGCTSLKELFCFYNELSYLDISNCTALIGIACDHNQLTTLDVNKNVLLTIINCQENQLSVLDVSKNTLLKRLSCSYNQLSTLDLNNNNLLEALWCEENQLTTLDVRSCTSLTELSCNDNQLTTLDVSNCTSLTKLWCYNNQLITLDVGNCTLLKSLWCDADQLTTLDVSNCALLTNLSCSGNKLTALDVSNCTLLTNLSCSSNQLSTLDLSNNESLEWLYCTNNQLTTLDVSNCPSLKRIYCIENPNLKTIYKKKGQVIDISKPEYTQIIEI